MKLCTGLAKLAFSLGLAASGFAQSGTAATEPALPAAASIHPALWQIKGAHGSVYLFGTVHLMKAGVPWKTPKVADAFKKSDALYLEVPDTTDPASMKKAEPLVMELGADPAHPLSTKITAGDKAALDAAFKRFGSPMGEASFEPFQPWFVYVTLSVLPAVKEGYDPANGIDAQLAKQARQEGKKVSGFETIEQQLHFLADMPQDQQIALLHQTIEDLPKSSDRVSEIVSDWEKGDVDAISQLSDRDIRQKSPALYKTLVIDRNETIADQIAALLKDPATGTIFVALGAAHLAGPDQIQNLLAKRGFSAERIE